VTAPTRPSIRQLELDNGLRLVLEEDHRQPLIAIEARIKGGLRAEGSYLGTGITHFIEHMLFKGTPTRPPGTIEQEIRRYGGTINAFTSMDTTGVSLFVESRYLKEALGLLADILQHAVFPQVEFEKERAVIISELQMNQDDPDRRIQQLFWSHHYLEHPYQYPILGYQPLLERLTVADLTSFYAAQYQPQQVVVACVGDLDPAATMTLARETFGAWPRGRVDPLQRTVPLEPPTASAKETSVELQVTTAYVLLGVSSTRLSDPATYPLDVLANILGQGRSSRLYETIVRKRQLASLISAWNYTPQDPGVFGIQFQTEPSLVPAAREAILGILRDVQQHGVTEAELRKAKRSLSAQSIFHLQTIEGKAGDLADAVAGTGDPLFFQRYVAAIEQVTREQVQDAARRTLDASKMTTAMIHPVAAAASGTTAQPAQEARMQMSRAVLSNGATTVVGVDRTLPIAAIVVAFRGGVRVETDQTQGLSNLTAQLLTKGTATRNALEIAQRVESLGGTLEPFSGRDGFGLVLQLLSPDLHEGLALMHELVTQSTFPEAEVAIQRQLIAQQLKASQDEIFEVGGRLLRRTLFDRHPYRFHPLGDLQTVPTLTRAQVMEFAKQWTAPSNTVIAVVGDVPTQRVTDTLQRTFGAIPARAAAWPSRIPEEAVETIRRASQVMEREQALIMLGFLGSQYAQEDRYALDVMTAVLSGMAGRLFQAVREQHGLSYTLGATHAPGWDPGYVLIYAATRPAEEPKVLHVIEEQLERAVAEGFAEDEVEQAKRYLIGGHRMDLQHVMELGKRIAIDELYGLGYDAWTTYEAKIDAVTAPMVHAAAKRYLTLRHRAEVVISPNGHAPQGNRDR